LVIKGMLKQIFGILRAISASLRGPAVASGGLNGWFIGRVISLGSLQLVRQTLVGGRRYLNSNSPRNASTCKFLRRSLVASNFSNCRSRTGSALSHRTLLRFLEPSRLFTSNKLCLQGSRTRRTFVNRVHWLSFNNHNNRNSHLVSTFS
jgi:hypothetical protein